jgi:hypothetical protein
MPGYGIAAAGEGSGLLPWSWAQERLRASHDYWIATVWPDGRPHVMPVWGAWAIDGEDTLWFSSSPESRKVRNIEAQPRCVATTDDPLEPVVLDGVADRVTDNDSIAAFTDAVNAKYETQLGVAFFTANACLRIRPITVIGLTESDFAGSPTRWSFD